MRYYGFSNYYLSSLQVGLQNAHCIAEMSTRYRLQTALHTQYQNWALDHRTIILLNGGNQVALHELLTYFDADENPYAWDYFEEDEQSLNGCLTCVGIIIPEEIYNAAQLVRTKNATILDIGLGFPWGKYIESTTESENYELTNWEFGLVERINSCGLAH